MPRLVQTVVNLVTGTSKLSFYFAATLVYVMVPAILVDVVMRYVFNNPTVWATELAILLFGPYFLLAGPYVLHIKGHVAMDIMRQKMSPETDRIFELLGIPVIVLFAGILLWYAAPLARDSWAYGETSFSAWNPPIWWTKAAVPLAMALLLAQAIAEFLRVLFRDPTLSGEQA